MGARSRLQRKIGALAALPQRLPVGFVAYDPQRFPASIQQPVGCLRTKDKTVSFAAGLFPITNELKESRALRGQGNGP